MAPLSVLYRVSLSAFSGMMPISWAGRPRYRARAPWQPVSQPVNKPASQSVGSSILPVTTHGHLAPMEEHTDMQHMHHAPTILQPARTTQRLAPTTYHPALAPSPHIPNDPAPHTQSQQQAAAGLAHLGLDHLPEGPCNAAALAVHQPGLNGVHWVHQCPCNGSRCTAQHNVLMQCQLPGY